MKRFALVILMCCTAAVAGCADNAKKIVGKWESAVEKNGVKTSFTLDFTADGKAKMQFDMGRIKFDFPEGTYKVEGDKLTITMKEINVGVDGKDSGKEKSQTATIKELTDDKLVVTGFDTGEKEKRDLTMTKKK